MKSRTICRCEEVTEEEILEAIANGDESLNAIKRRTRAGMGLCQGKTCRRLIAQIIAREKRCSVDKFVFGSFRPPNRPVTLEILAKSDIGGSEQDETNND